MTSPCWWPCFQASPVPKRLQASKELSQIAQVQAFLYENTTEFNLPDHVCFKLELAVVEVFTNVVKVFPGGGCSIHRWIC